MRTNLATALGASDYQQLATAFTRTAQLSPDPAWTSWLAIANRGVAAAKKGDGEAIQAACKECHDKWRNAYRDKYRKRPIPH
jgi:hypothetical protein